jgi:hypothetical protein
MPFRIGSALITAIAFDIRAVSARLTCDAMQWTWQSISPGIRVAPRRS